MAEPTPYGYELTIDLHDCDQARFTKAGVRRFCEELCDLIEMNREDFHIWASDPADYDKDPPHLHGISAVQFITTSSLVIHTLPKLRCAYVNVFSCKWFDEAAARVFVATFFKGTIAQAKFMPRM
ncbi:MAG: S-adenosylmethionine decarboxylase [Planctomycetes bacterium]|nr:S-adenosylmethionine decarboxylase [Planctomycetota bacterium]